MKKALLCFLATLTLVLNIFALTSCKKAERITLLGAARDGITVEDKGRESVVRFYVDPNGGYDVADYEDVRIKFTYEQLGNSKKTVKEKAQVPENARGNPELQYFYVVVDDPNLDDEGNISIYWAKGTFAPEELVEEQESKMPSIGVTFIIAIVGGAICLGLICLGLAVRDDIRGKVLIGIGLVFPPVSTVFSFISWNVGRGVIFLVFTLIIFVASFVASKYIDY